MSLCDPRDAGDMVGACRHGYTRMDGECQKCTARRPLLGGEMQAGEEQVGTPTDIKPLGPLATSGPSGGSHGLTAAAEHKRIYNHGGFPSPPPTGVASSQGQDEGRALLKEAEGSMRHSDHCTAFQGCHKDCLRYRITTYLSQGEVRG